MFAKKLSRREMAVWWTALALGCVLAGLSGFALDWGRTQLDTGTALCADTLRLHIRADTDSVRDQSAKLAVRDAVLVLTGEACPADSRADARAWAAENLVLFELTARQTLAALGIRAPVKACWTRPPSWPCGTPCWPIRMPSAGHPPSRKPCTGRHRTCPRWS